MNELAKAVHTYREAVKARDANSREDDVVYAKQRTLLGSHEYISAKELEKHWDSEITRLSEVLTQTWQSILSSVCTEDRDLDERVRAYNETKQKHLEARVSLRDVQSKLDSFDEPNDVLMARSDRIIKLRHAVESAEIDLRRAVSSRK